MKRLGFSLVAVLFSATANAQQSADIAKICTPILFNATVASIEDKTKSQLFRHYVTLIYSRRSESLEKLEKEGFELGVVIEEVPIKALWSNDEATKRKAESVYSKYVDNTLLSNKVREYKEVKDNSFATAAYNTCVTTMASTLLPVGCFYSPIAERDRVTFNVLFRPSFVIGNARIKNANIVNGFMLPTDTELERLTARQKKALEDALETIGRGEKLAAAPAGTSTKLKIKNGMIDVGSHSFDIFRLDPDRITSVNLQWENNLGCNPPAAPIARSAISTAIWPAGRDWAAGSDVFEYAATSGCGPGGSVPQEFCTASDSRITSIAPANPYSVNCSSGFQGVVMKPNSTTCVIATATVGGCGFTKPWKTCKGRGWVKARITVNKESPGQTYAPQRSVESDSILEASWTKLFEYRGELPEKFEADAWKFSVEIKRQLSTGVETFVLTDDDAEQGDCVAKVTGGKRDARVVVSCGPRRLVPATLLLPQ